ncbi:MAG: DUF4476 domain-containing protein [Flavobacteriales bacterium]|nr:DUF4476 domain-containing protein [Flavobacteriales bacterium]
MLRIWMLIIFMQSLIILGQESCNLIISSEDSTIFQVKLNGKVISDSTYWNYKITGISKASNEIVITIDSDDLELSKTVLFQEMNVEATLKVTNTSGGYKLRYFGEVSMGAAPIENNQLVIELSPKTKPTSTQSFSSKTSVLSVSDNLSFVGTTYSSTEMTQPALETTQSITESTSTYKSESDLDSATILLYDSLYAEFPEIKNYLLNYQGKKGCQLPLGNAEGFAKKIRQCEFSSQKLNEAKKVVRTNCVTTEQVRVIASELEFEDDRLEFVRFAYISTYDQDNYYKLSSLFNLDKTKSEFKKFINR